MLRAYHHSRVRQSLPDITSLPKLEILFASSVGIQAYLGGAVHTVFGWLQEWHPFLCPEIIVILRLRRNDFIAQLVFVPAPAHARQVDASGHVGQVGFSLRVRGLNFVTCLWCEWRVVHEPMRHQGQQPHQCGWVPAAGLLGVAHCSWESDCRVAQHWPSWQSSEADAQPQQAHLQGAVVRGWDGLAGDDPRCCKHAGGIPFGALEASTAGLGCSWG